MFIFHDALLIWQELCPIGNKLPGKIGIEEAIGARVKKDLEAGIGNTSDERDGKTKRKGNGPGGGSYKLVTK